MLQVLTNDLSSFGMGGLGTGQDVHFTVNVIPSTHSGLRRNKKLNFLIRAQFIVFLSLRSYRGMF